MEVAGRTPSESGDITKTCDSCAGRPGSSVDRIAIGYCAECRMYLCVDCCDFHRRFPQLKTHGILTGKQLPDEKLAPVDICESHHGEKILYFCISHSALACQKCAFLNHRSCKDVQDIPAVAKDPKTDQRYTQLSQKIKSINSKLDQSRQTVTQNMSKIDSSRKNVKADIKQFCKALHDYLYTIEQSMDDELDQISQEDNRQMNKLQQECDSVSADLKVVTTMLESNKGHNQREQLFIAIEKISKTIKGLEDRLTALDRDNVVSDHKFDPDDRLKALMTDVKRAGRLVTAQKTPSWTLDSVTADTDDDINLQTQTAWITSCITGAAMMEGDTRLALVDTETLYDALGNSCVTMVDVIQKKVISHIHLSGVPWDITQVKQDQLAVTLSEHHEIQFLQVTKATTLSLGRQMKVSGNCYGIAYNNDRLFVSFTFPGQVQILSMSGGVLHTISSRTDGMIKLRDPFYLTLSVDKSLLYVSDAGTNTVYCLDTNGKLKSTFQDQGLRSPRGVCAGDDGSVIVCGSASNKVYAISSDCSRGRVLVEEARGVHYPYSVACSWGLGKIYLSQYNADTLKVLKLK